MLSRCYADLWLIMQAEVLRSRGKVLEAMALFDQTLTLDPYNIHATMLKASSFVRLPSFQITFCAGNVLEAAESVGEGAIFHCSLRRIHRRCAQAVQCYQRVLEIHSHDWCAHNNLGVLMKERGDLAKVGL